MLDPQSTAVLQEIVRRESLSLLSYVGDAFLWTTARGVPALGMLQQLVHAHREAVADLGRFLTRKRAPVGYIGSYPTSFTTINFVALDYLLPRLTADEQRGVARLERDLAAITDADAQDQAKRFLQLKRDRLRALELLAAEYGKQLAG
jgi:hypothetical protein